MQTLRSHSFFYPYFLIISALIIVLFISGCSANTADETNAESAEGADENYHEITHEMGVTEVPDEPKRIAVLSPNYVDNLYVYDVIPVLAAESSLTNEKVSSHLPQELYEDVQFIGGDDFNLEAILEAEPDLIIGQDKAGKLYDELSSIAPTVILGNDEWRETHAAFGQILGMEEESKIWLDQYEDKAAEAKQNITASLGEETVAFMRVLPKEFRIHGTTDQRFIDGTLYQDLGLNPSEGVPEERKAISLEGIATVNADHFLLEYNTASQQDTQAEERYNTLMESRVWQQTKAVKQSNVHTVPDWFIQVGPHARTMAIDYVAETLVD